VSRRTARALTAGVAVLVVLTAVGAGYALLRPGPVAYTPVTRSYFIAAQPEAWNYTPSAVDGVTGQSLTAPGSTSLPYVAHNATYLGSTLEKCVYVQYTSASFTTVVPQPAYLGFLGPTLYAVVGDTISIQFHNSCPFPESMHPHGVFYNKTSEGAVYNYSIAGDNGGDAVPPGSSWHYTWTLPARAGPGPMDGSSIMWMYHSHVYEPVDINTGLIGFIVISQPGDANPDGTPKDIGMNICLLFNVFDESVSSYLPSNVAQYALDPAAVNASDPNWIASLQKYTINGYSFGTMPTLTIPFGTHVRWYVMGMGLDYHAATFEGNTVLYDGARTNAISLAPASMAVADMWANDSGAWTVFSSLPVDVAAGMEARYVVLPAPAGSVTVVPTGGLGEPPVAVGTAGPVAPSAPELARWR
jgi:manganese oxidase